MPQFIAIDGEGYTRDDGQHIYNLIAASSGESLLTEHPNGLRTKAIIDWLFELKSKYPKAIFVSFYFAYDVNMILRNVPTKCIRTLAEKGFVRLDDKDDKRKTTKLEYMPVKFFTLSHGFRTGTIGNGDFQYCALSSITIWDVWGFFQGSFLKGMKQFKIGTTEELELIASMKGSRQDFGEVSIEDIITYNQLECKLLVDAMNKLSDALDVAQLRLTSWHGAGACAMAMFKKYDVLRHIEQAKDTHVNPVLHAYFGGRIQAIRIGDFNGSTFGHDIVSAYPNSCLNLPSLRGMSQEVVTDYEENKDKEFIIWRVRWCLPSDTLINPFPFRMPDGRITYPYEGEGYYWACEVNAAMEYYAEYISVFEGYEFVINDLSKPFDFIKIVFEDRKRFKAEGNHAQVALKLSMNSAYGKCAQGKSYGGKIPKSQCLIWAGLITAYTRRDVFSLAMSKDRGKSIIAFSTDGVFAQERLTVTDCVAMKEGNNAYREGDDLGEWEVNEYRTFFNLKSGFYRGRRIDGKTVRHYRGFRASEIRFSLLQSIWRCRGIFGTCTANTRRFIGMKAAGKTLKNWRRWIDSTKELCMFPSTGDVVIEHEPESVKREVKIGYKKEDIVIKNGKGLRYTIYGQSMMGFISKPYDGDDNEFDEKDDRNSEEKIG